jgi:hypothetical protein
MTEEPELAEDLDDPGVDAVPSDEVRESRNGSSMLEGLRRAREEIAAEHTVTLPVPGYNGSMRIRYKYVEWVALMKIAEKVEKSKSPLRVLNAHCDTLIKACDEILAVESDVEVPMSEVLGLDEPVRFDGAGATALAEAFGFTANSARDVVRGLFNNDLAVTEQHNEVAEWMKDRNSEVDEDFLGKSEGAPRSNGQLR